MPVLCLDTSSRAPVAVLLGDTPEHDRGAIGEGRAQDVAGLLDELLQGADRSTIEAVVVGLGPGGFTGLRIGVSMARGIAETLGVPLYGVDSLLAAVIPTLRDADGDVAWSLLDARRGELFAQEFHVTADGRVEPVDTFQAVKVEQVAALVGDMPHADAVSPGSLAAAARQLLADPARGDGDPLAVVPNYGRDPDAEPRRLELRVDALGERDLDALLVLEERCFANPWTREMYAQELRRAGHQRVNLAARDATSGNRLVGAAVTARIGDSWHVMNVLVDPSARRRGIAARLLQDVLDRTAELGAGEGWTLEVRDENEAAIELYRRFGFDVAGRRPGYYQDTGEDALVMWRHADAPSPAPAGATP